MALKMSQGPPAFRSIPASENLITVAAELNAATKELTTVFKDIEAGLQKLNLGVSAWVDISLKEDETSSELLGYTKCNGRWGLVVRQFELDGAGEVISHKDCFLSDAPREIRVWAASQLNELFAELIKQAEQLTARIKKNLSDADGLVAVLSVAATRRDGKGAKQ